MKYKKINLNNVLRQEEVGEKEEADEAPGRPESANPLSKTSQWGGALWSIGSSKVIRSGQEYEQ